MAPTLAESKEKNSTSETHRLPCRGCTDSCKNYSICDGKPWRMKPSNAK